jgi:hypothetical protein
MLLILVNKLLILKYGPLLSWNPCIIFRGVLRIYTNNTEHLKRDLYFERFQTETSIQNYSFSMHKDKTQHTFQQLHCN